MPDRRLKVLFVSLTLNTGGAQRFTSTILQHLDRDLMEPSLCLMRDDIGYALPGDVPLHQLRYRGVADFPNAASRLRGIVERHVPDVVLSNVNATNLLAGVALRRCRHRPGWIARIGSNPRLHDSLARRILARLVYPRADRIVANSQGLAREVRGCFGRIDDALEVLATPTDFAAITEQSISHPEVTRSGESPLMIAVGRLVPQKRYDRMLDALARVRRSFPAELWVCGDGPLRSTLEARARRLSLEPAVRWLGFRQNPYALMRQSDLFVLTSEHEGLPNALIESQGLGIPAVSTRCPHGPEEVVEHGGSGLLVAVGDVGGFASAVECLLSDPERRRRMGDTAARLARQRFGCADLVRRWQDLIVRVARKRNGSSGELATTRDDESPPVHAR